MSIKERVRIAWLAALGDENEIAAANAQKDSLQFLQKENEALLLRAQKAEAVWSELVAERADLKTRIASLEWERARAESGVVSQLMQIAIKANRRLVAKRDISVNVHGFNSAGGEYGIESLHIVVGPKFVINAICSFLGIEDQEHFWANLPMNWEERLRSAVKDGNRGALFSDLYPELSGRLTAKSHCGMCKGKHTGGEEREKENG